MEFYPNQDDKGYHLNPHNKFLLIFCHAYDVGEGWGFIVCRSRPFSFKFGVSIFSAIILLGVMSDLVDIISMDELKYNKNEIFVKIFYVRLASVVLIIFEFLFSVFSIFGSTYHPAVIIGYYLVAISFYLNKYIKSFIKK